MNLTISIDGSLSVTEGDRIASRVEELVTKSVSNVRRVHVHYHPTEAGHAARTIDEILETPRYPEYYE